MLEEIEASALNLINAVKKARNGETHHQERIAALEKENQLLRNALEVMAAKRRKDKEIIKQWQEYLRQTERAVEESSRQSTTAHLIDGQLKDDQLKNGQLKNDQLKDSPTKPEQTAMSEVLTQEAGCGAPIPSSPPVSNAYEENAPELPHQQHDSPIPATQSQRLLPVSIGIGELSDDSVTQGEEPRLTQDSDTSNRASTALSDSRDEYEPLGLYDKGVHVAGGEVCGEQSSSHGKRMASEQRELPQTRRVRTIARSYSSPNPGSEQNDEPTELRDLIILAEREWHPSDFKLNPARGSTGSNAAWFAFSEVVRNKKARKCLHGSDCKDCAKFYDLLGFDPAARAATVQIGSRHRQQFDKQETPAGFWRTEFPDSEDARADDRQAQSRAAAEGHKRLAEALVEGKYVFKDEQLRELVRKSLTSYVSQKK